MKMVCRLVTMCVAFVALAAGAAENAALISRGAKIRVECDHAKPMNTRWAKPAQMLSGKKPKGPIFNALPKTSLIVTLPMPMTVEKVGIRPGDYRDSFAMPKDIEVSSPGKPSKSFTLTQDAQLQILPYEPGKVTEVKFAIKSVYPPKKGDSKRIYGVINQLQVLVSDNVDELFKTPDTYKAAIAAHIMRTTNLDPKGAKTIGTPRIAKGYPCTIWDTQDIARFRKAIKTQPKAKAAYEGIVSFCENACKQKMKVPDEPDMGNNPAVANMHTRISSSIANLGIGYALSGDERFANEAKLLLLQLADRYEGWPVHQHPKMKHDSSKWSWQRLSDAIWLIPAAWGFDLVYSSKSMSEAEREKIRDHFIMPCVKNIMRSSSIIRAPTNWSAICCAAVMIGSRVSGNKEFYQKSVKGLRNWQGFSRNAVNDDAMMNNQGGFFFFVNKAIDDDGMWAEGAIGYQFMAMRGMLVMAEILWRDGINGYAYRNGRLKLIFDSPIWYCYPGGGSSPAIHDSGSSSLFGRDAHLYQYALRRYGDDTYNSILHKVTPTFESVYNLFLPACDFGQVDAAKLPAIPSIHFPGVGFAIGRTGDGADSKYMLMDYGPNRSHGHPDKLNLCLYGLGQELFADGGSSWYTTEIYQKYYSKSLAHNTIFANGQSQIKTGGKLEAYGQLDDMVLMRASCDTAIPAAVLDRTLLMSGQRVYDIFAAKSSVPYTFDLPYHGAGKMDQKIAKTAWDSPEIKGTGYAFFKNPTIADVDGDWSCTWQVPRGSVKMHAMGEKGTQVIFATTPKGASKLPTAMFRRKARQTVFACALDIISKEAQPSIKSVRKLDLNGKGYALVASLVDGSKETVIANYTHDTVSADGWSTDARVAFVREKNGKIERAYVSGGGTLSKNGMAVKVSTPSIVAYAKVKDDLAALANQGAQATSVKLGGIQTPDRAYELSADGSRGKGSAVSEAAVSLKAHGTVELTKGQQPSIKVVRAAERQAKIRKMLAQQADEAAAAMKAYEAQLAKANAAKLPVDTYVLVQAESFAAQGGGKVSKTSKKTATYKEAFSGWNNPEHWLEYDVTIPKTGYYQVVFRYCREGDTSYRAMKIDGAFPHESAERIALPGTGGWSNGADNWRYQTMNWSALDKPHLVRLTAGKHKVRLVAVTGGGLNLDYFVFASHDMNVTRKTVEK